MRVGLAGYSFGRNLHAPLLREAGATIAAIATSSPERVAQAHEDEPQADVVPDLAALLTVPDLDVVVVSTPSGAHFEHVMACLEARIPVVIDKPLSVDATSAQKLVDSAKERQVPLTVFQNRRFDAGHLNARRVLRDGELGVARRLEMRWERWRPEPMHRWREDAPPEQGGGVLLDLHTHLIDAAIDLLGPVTSVYAEVAAYTTTSEDDAVVVCRHAGGQASMLWASSVCAAPGPRTRLLGSTGAFLYDDFEGALAYPDLADAPGCLGWIYRGAERTPVPSPQGAPVDFYRGVAAALADEDYERRQAAMPVDPQDAVDVLRVVDAARESARLGHSVVLAEV